ncbi:hypothetical protein V6N13_133972 [Hibiscus sabdariffa]
MYDYNHLMIGLWAYSNTYIYFRSSASPRVFSPNLVVAALNFDGIMLPRIIFVAKDEDNENIVIRLDQGVINSYPKFQFSKES